MKNLKQKLYDFIIAIITGLIIFLILTIVDYFLKINEILLKKILSGLAGGILYFIEKLNLK